MADRYNQLLDLVTMETDEGEHPIMIALINAIPFDNMVRNVSNTNKLVGIVYISVARDT